MTEILLLVWYISALCALLHSVLKQFSFELLLPPTVSQCLNTSSLIIPLVYYPCQTVES